MTLQGALRASSLPRGGCKTKKRETPRACPLFEYPFFDARTASVLEPACGGCRLVPRRGSGAKSAVCGLNGPLPPLRVGAFHLNPRPRSALLRLCLFAPCSNENSRFRFGKKNCALLTFSLLNGIQRFRERRGERRPHGSAETPTAITDRNNVPYRTIR